MHLHRFILCLLLVLPLWPALAQTNRPFRIINVGATANDGTGDSLRTSQQKVNENFSNTVAGVSISTNTLADGDVLTWLASMRRWTNYPAQGGGGGGQVSTAQLLVVSNQTQTASNSLQTQIDAISGPTNGFTGTQVTNAITGLSSNVHRLVTNGITSAGLINTPVKILFDEDFNSDADDVGGLLTLHALADQGKVEILGATTVAQTTNAIRSVHVVNTFSGRPYIPLGVSTNSTIAMDYTWPGYISTNVYPSVVKVQPYITNSVALWRSILANNPTGTVTVIVGGQMKNLFSVFNSTADAISSDNGSNILRRAAKLVIIGGQYPFGHEYNFYTDPDSAQVINSMTNFPIDWVSFESGNGIFTGSEAQFLSKEHPYRVAMTDMVRQNVGTWTSGRQSWGAIAALWAAGVTNNLAVRTNGYQYVGPNAVTNAATNQFIFGPTSTQRQIFPLTTNRLQDSIASLQSVPKYSSIGMPERLALKDVSGTYGGYIGVQNQASNDLAFNTSIGDFILRPEAGKSLVFTEGGGTPVARIDVDGQFGVTTRYKLTDTLNVARWVLSYENDLIIGQTTNDLAFRMESYSGRLMFSAGAGGNPHLNIHSNGAVEFSRQMFTNTVLGTTPIETNAIIGFGAGLINGFGPRDYAIRMATTNQFGIAVASGAAALTVRSNGVVEIGTLNVDTQNVRQVTATNWLLSTASTPGYVLAVQGDGVTIAPTNSSGGGGGSGGIVTGPSVSSNSIGGVPIYSVSASPAFTNIAAPPGKRWRGVNIAPKPEHLTNAAGNADVFDWARYYTNDLTFWTNVSADVTLAATNGFNAVRFMFNPLDVVSNAITISNLCFRAAYFAKVCETNGVDFYPTLSLVGRFGSSPLSGSDLTTATNYIAQLAAALGTNRAVKAFDMSQETLILQSSTESNFTNMLGAFYKATKSAAPSIPATMSINIDNPSQWQSMSNIAAWTARYVDFMDFHWYYDNPQPGETVFFTNTSKPIIFGEYGIAESRGESNRTYYARRMQALAAHPQVEGSFAWCLVDGSGTNGGPWNFGIIDASTRQLKTNESARIMARMPALRMTPFRSSIGLPIEEISGYSPNIRINGTTTNQPGLSFYWFPSEPAKATMTFQIDAETDLGSGSCYTTTSINNAPSWFGDQGEIVFGGSSGVRASLTAASSFFAVKPEPALIGNQLLYFGANAPRAFTKNTAIIVTFERQAP